MNGDTCNKINVSGPLVGPHGAVFDIEERLIYALDAIDEMKESIEELRQENEKRQLSQIRDRRRIKILEGEVSGLNDALDKAEERLDKAGEFIGCIFTYFDWQNRVDFIEFQRVIRKEGAHRGNIQPPDMKRYYNLDYDSPYSKSYDKREEENDVRSKALSEFVAQYRDPEPTQTSKNRVEVLFSRLKQLELSSSPWEDGQVNIPTFCKSNFPDMKSKYQRYRFTKLLREDHRFIVRPDTRQGYSGNMVSLRKR